MLVATEFLLGGKTNINNLNEVGDGRNQIFPFCLVNAFLQEKLGISDHLLSWQLGSFLVSTSAGVSLMELTEVFSPSGDQCVALTS